MDMERLKVEFRKIGIKEKNVHIGDEPFLEERYNMIKQPDGNWEVFFAERGQKTDLCKCETEAAAADALLELIIERRGINTANVRQSFFTRWKQRKSDNDQ